MPVPQGVLAQCRAPRSARCAAIAPGDTIAKAIRRIMLADVIVIDDIGLLPVATETAEARYRVVDAASAPLHRLVEQRLTTAGFDELMPKYHRKRHRRSAPPPRPHIVMTVGDSIRLTQATAGKGVTPLTN